MIVLTDQNFENEVLKSDIPVLVDFWAPWCGPCQVYGPIIEEVARDFEGKIKVGKLNVDENQDTPTQYNIMGIPTTIFFKNGQAEKIFVGLQAKEGLVEEINKIANIKYTY